MLVVGASSGGMQAISRLLTGIPANFSMAILIVQHIAASSDGSWTRILDSRCKIAVREADEKEPIRPGIAYFAPANYHLLVEPDRTLTLTVDEPVNYARPSIDVLFETAADAYGFRLIGLVMTGANSDGAKGLEYVKNKGGLTIVQDPETAETPFMPRAAIQQVCPDHILAIEAILELLISLHQRNRSSVS